MNQMLMYALDIATAKALFKNSVLGPLYAIIFGIVFPVAAVALAVVFVWKIINCLLQAHRGEAVGWQDLMFAAAAFALALFFSTATDFSALGLTF